MRRKLKARDKRTIEPDYKFGSFHLAKFTNYVMRNGKKSLAQKIVYSALHEIRRRTKKDPLGVFETALKNATPLMEVRSRRVGGAHYQVPRPVPSQRGTSLAMRWIIASAKARKGKPMHLKLADELISAAKNEGEAIKKKENSHRAAEANRAFAHFAW
jgi:small subunit ribosomal protein S7